MRAGFDSLPASRNLFRQVSTACTRTPCRRAASDAVISPPNTASTTRGSMSCVKFLAQSDLEIGYVSCRASCGRHPTSFRWIERNSRRLSVSLKAVTVSHSTPAPNTSLAKSISAHTRVRAQSRPDIGVPVDTALRRRATQQQAPQTARLAHPGRSARPATLRPRRSTRCCVDRLNPPLRRTPVRRTQVTQEDQLRQDHLDRPSSS